MDSKVLARLTNAVTLEQTYAAMRKRMRDFPGLRVNFIDPKTGKLPPFMDPDLPENLKKDGLES